MLQMNSKLKIKDKVHLSQKAIIEFDIHSNKTISSVAKIELRNNGSTPLIHLTNPLIDSYYLAEVWVVKVPRKMNFSQII